MEDSGMVGNQADNGAASAGAVYVYVRKNRIWRWRRSRRPVRRYSQRHHLPAGVIDQRLSAVRDELAEVLRLRRRGSQP
jgi:hypothetical protein